MMQVGTNQSTTYHSQPSLSTSGGQAGRSSSTSRQQQQQQQPQYDSEQLANIRPRLCVLRKWPHYDGYGVHLARNQHWLGLRIGDVEPNSPAESGGLLREDVVLAVNGHSVENDDFFVILSFIQHELEDDQIRFLVLDPHSADLARRNRLIIDENYRTCVRMETPTLTVSPEKLLYDQWRSTNVADPNSTQNTIHLGPTVSSFNQQQQNTQRYHPPQSQDGRDDVYTFLPYSDHAVENGKSFFDILFDQEKPSSTSRQQKSAKQPVQQSAQFQTTQESTGGRDDNGDDDDENDKDYDNDQSNDEPDKEKRRRSDIKENVKDFFKSGLANIKSVLPSRNRENSETSSDLKSTTKNESLDSNTENTNTSTQEKQSQAYERLWETPSSSSHQEDPSAAALSEARICSVRLRPGIDTIGISLQPDKDFGHIIKQVESNSPADRSGIEKDDCIVSLNDTPLLNAPYEDVLNTLKRSRNEPTLDFVVINKYDLLKKRQNPASSSNVSQDVASKYTDPSSRSTAEVMPSSNIAGRNNTTSIPPTQALEQLYNKYTNDQTSSTDDRYAPKQQQQQQQSGQIYQGVGPATVDRSSWSASDGKSNEDPPAVTSGDASVRSSSQDRRSVDTDVKKERTSSLEDSFKPLQVGITNQTASQQSGNVSPIASASPKSPTTRAQQTTSSSSPVLPPPPPASTSEPSKATTNLAAAVPIAPTQSSTSSRDYEQETPSTLPAAPAEYRLGNGGAPISLPVRNIAPMNVYEDTDDDLSDISEESREEDISDHVNTKNLQSVPQQKNKPSSESLQSPTSGVYTPASTLNTTEKTSKSQGLTATVTDASKQSSASPSTEKQVVKARRLLEQSDSDDTTSASDSHLTKQSGPETFYSPQESADEGNNANNQQQNVTPTKSTDNKLNQQQNQDDTEEDEDTDSESETSSTESDNTSVPKGIKAFATMPLSELPNNGYELHNIQLMQPTETSPVGLKLTKQQNPLQFVITAVAKGTKADLAGLKVNDWLIKIEDKDIRLTDFPEVSHEIRQLLTNAGLINMVIARKKTPSSSPVLKPAVKQQTTPSSSIRSESISRQQGASAPTSILTTDITRDTPDNSQVRFVPDRSPSPPTARGQRSPASNRGGNVNAPTGPLSVGITNPISDDQATRSPRSPRSQSRSPTREFPVNQQQKTIINERKSDEYDPSEIREIVLKEALGLDFNSFIPEGDSQVQTHFISNVQASSMADRAGLRDGDRILTVNGIDVTNSVHEDVRRMMQAKKPLQLTVVNDPKYIELIENVKRSQASPESKASPSRTQIKSPITESNNESSNLRSQKSDSPVPSAAVSDELKKYTQTLFTDNDGPVQIKHCILKKDPTYNGYGLLLRYQNTLHLIDQVEEDSPAFNAGLREDDVILYVDQKSVEKMTHDDVKILIRSLSLSNTNIDLILIRKSDMQRYRNYQQQNKIDWEPILSNQTEQQQQLSVTRSSDDTTTPRKTSSSSSGKQPAPAPPTSAPPTNLAPGTRLCILHPSVDRTAGFALRGKAPPPYIICQIERDSPAEKAGLLLNDALLSINGKSVADKTYEETVKLVKEALQQRVVELLVREQSSASSPSSKVQSNMGNQSLLSSSESNNARNSDSFGNDPSHEGSNAVEQYQKQRNKELSYTLRLCHLHPTNADGTQAATFGFELSEEPDYDYPIILRVEPQSSAEGAGLQSRDVLLKINDRKTKGLGYDKVKKEIEKAKRDGRLEMLVADQETYDYCQRTKKPMKEPEMKVKHIFPKSRSSASFNKLPIGSGTSRDSTEQLNASTTKSDDNPQSYSRSSVGYRLSTPRETDSENEEDKQHDSLRKDSSSAASLSRPTQTRTSQREVNFEIDTPSATHAQASNNVQHTPLKFIDPAQRGSGSSAGSNVPETSRSTPALNQTSTKDSKSSKTKNPISSLFHRFSHSKSSKPDLENAPKATTSTKTRAPSPPTIRVGHNRLDAQYVSQSLDTTATSAPISSAVNDTVRSTISTGSFDYLRGPRRCVLKVDRNKGLGFVLSATGDYDHTITAVEKFSAADVSGLQVNDEVLEVDGVDVRNVKYEQVVEMLVTAMRTNDTIEMRVIDGSSREAYTSQTDIHKQINPAGLLNSNNNNNNSTSVLSTTRSQRTNGASGDDLSDINSSIGPFDSVNQQKINTSYPNLPGQLRQFDHATNRILSGSVPALATGITASPNAFNHPKSITTLSEKGSMTKLSDISTQDAPVARLCRVRKFPTSPFYGFFLCGDPKKLGRVFISDVTKHSPAAVCGLRDGDRIVEINGSTIETLTYETVLDRIKEHMARDDLELLVLDKKALHWYRERNFPISSRTLPTIVHMEPILNDGSLETQSLEVPSTHTKMVGFADRRVSKTGL